MCHPVDLCTIDPSKKGKASATHIESSRLDQFLHSVWSLNDVFKTDVFCGFFNDFQIPSCDVVKYS